MFLEGGALSRCRGHLCQMGVRSRRPHPHCTLIWGRRGRGPGRGQQCSLPVCPAVPLFDYETIGLQAYPAASGLPNLSPTSTRILSSFCLGAKVDVEYFENAEGGLNARLKSSQTAPSSWTGSVE